MNYTSTSWDIEIKMIVPYDCLIFYEDEFDDGDLDDYEIETTFLQIMELLAVKIDIRRIIDYLTVRDEKQYAFEVHYSNNSNDEFIIFNTYQGKTDQLDLIEIMFRGKSAKGDTLRKMSHEFYTKMCEYNISYAEGNNVIRYQYKVDFTQPDLIKKTKELNSKNVVLYRNESILKQVNKSPQNEQTPNSEVPIKQNKWSDLELNKSWWKFWQRDRS